MGRTEKILILHNEIEARLLEGLLRQKGIPCVIKSYHDSAYDGLWQGHMGWGHLEASPEHREEILKLYEEMAK
jgi:hypothetical protein